MDPMLAEHVLGIPIRSTKELLLFNPNPPQYPLFTTSCKINGIEREDGFAVWIKNYVSLGLKLVEIMRHKLSYGAKVIKFGSQDKSFRKSFGIKEGEKLLQASQCYLYTTTGAIAGLLFVSTQRVAFCSNRSIKTYSTTGKLIKFQYKVSIPLRKIKGVGESMDITNASNKFVELVTIDGFSFWFMGFFKHKETLRFLHHAISLDCLSL
ncbi:GRAM domain-containing protein [Artemisia annua]|uniref:GRAM domain-containing protein n=1 Tax=Artemisia annua TaxID=35608 RepID=A0A2U1LPW3_ARTAN|nr:GRAM domain-containing protein [Artemisia annua]